MRLSMGQMAMQDDMAVNLKTSLKFCDAAAKSDLLFFPEIQLTPFFPQYEKLDASKYCLEERSAEIAAFQEKARAHHYYLSPNVYLKQGGASDMIHRSGSIRMEKSPVWHRWYTSHRPGSSTRETIMHLRKMDFRFMIRRLEGWGS